VRQNGDAGQTRAGAGGQVMWFVSSPFEARARGRGWSRVGDRGRCAPVARYISRRSSGGGEGGTRSAEGGTPACRSQRPARNSEPEEAGLIAGNTLFGSVLAPRSAFRVRGEGRGADVRTDLKRVPAVAGGRCCGGGAMLPADRSFVQLDAGHGHDAKQLKSPASDCPPRQRCPGRLPFSRAGRGSGIGWRSCCSWR
jgi:hypothetical protein